MKQCIICDTFIRDQKEEYKKNHYICSGNCAVYYVHCINWDKREIDIDVLNEIRRETIGIDKLEISDIEKRID